MKETSDISLETIINLVKEPKMRTRRNKIRISKNILLEIIELAEKENWNLLNLSNSGIEELPSEIGKLKKLRVLNLRGAFLGKNTQNSNCLKILPKEIGELTNLKVLDLSNNPLEEVPIEIANLKKLNTLHLFNTELNEIPIQIFNLTELETLSFPGKVESIPPEVGQLVKLKELAFPDSAAIELPEQIGNLQNLEQLYLAHSNIRFFPNSIINLRKLKRLTLRFTYFSKNIPLEILNQSSQEVASFIIRYQEDQHKVKLNESKMLIVGQGGVGKTSLLKRLIHNEYRDSNSDSTEGIDIERWKFTSNSENYILNVWDFGGQEIYHSTHQFFLTSRSLYILVWDARQEDEYGRLDYWLNTVESFAGDIPILLVINKCDERKSIKYVDLKSLKIDFPQIVDAYRISCQTGTGISELQQAIQEETTKLPLMDIVWLSSWVEVRKHLEELSLLENLISFNEYLKVCESYGIQEGEAKSLSKYLHDLGIILHFHEDVLLKNIVILSPDWGTDAVYKVLDAEEEILKDRYGYLYYEDLSKIWTDRDTYPEDKYPLILRLMENFQLSFEVERNKTFLIPQLMGNEEFEIKNAPSKSDDRLNFQYTYEFLPAGVMTRFIVKAHSYLLEKDNKKACWKKGAFLKYNDTLGEVRLFDSLTNKRIEITINGGSIRNKQELLRRIRGYFDDIHQNIKKLKVTEEIRCNCGQAGCKQRYDYNLLLRYEKNEIYETFCNTSLKKINVLTLLDGIEYKNQRSKESDEYMERPPIVFNNNINNTNTNTNTNENVTHISIDIRNIMDNLQGSINDLKGEVISEEPVLEKDFKKLESCLTNLNEAKTQEAVKRSGALPKINRFLEELQDDNSLLGKTVINIKYGSSIAQDIASKYNSIAEWCGFPTVPKLFLKKK
ncbi:hypothetical protein CW306_00510 [Bacillus sp. BA3]|uniref:COR domain-containing protein n=1 Tax=Bacillus sp. BA3 TaxID=2057910 RepID=UPI000C344ADE|nr:COR domain-containing protein [Bacillus sp. BA3]PKF90054.1 hypothetical protein CW306_00510 [Bacillus sp. BA3]